MVLLVNPGNPAMAVSMGKVMLLGFQRRKPARPPS
jgi:hypothetical protein